MNVKADVNDLSCFPVYDFSKECPLFKEKLKAEFLRAAKREQEIIPLFDTELEQLSAAGVQNQKLVSKIMESN